MRLASSGRPPAADDVAGALTASVGMLGQRPAVTGHVPDPSGSRREQGYASLAGWVAKGANLLRMELGLDAGDRLALAGPPGWPLAAVTLSAWWLGVTVVPYATTVGEGGPGADVVVTHASTRTGGTGGTGTADPAMPHLELGDALDGTSGNGSMLEQWTDAVTPHGDRPPLAAHDGDLVALVTTDGVAYTQRELLASFAGVRSGPDGVLGMLRHGDEDLLSAPDAARRLAALALRPLVTGAATVVVTADDPARDAIARAERIAHWLD